MGTDLGAVSYYNHSKFSNTFYLAQMALEMYFAKLLFADDLSRILYASPETSFRKRLIQLEQTTPSSISQLNLPFLSYYRETNWAPDDRLSLPNYQTFYNGLEEPSLGYIPLRFLYVKTDFQCVAFFYRDDDAQLAYNSLITSNTPAVKQFLFPGLEYRDHLLNLPVVLEVSRLTFQPDVREKTWLESARIIPISFITTIRTIMFFQQPHVIGTTPPPGPDTIYITRRVLLDFLSYKYGPRITESSPELELIATFTDVPELQGQINVENITTSSARLIWSYASNARSILQSNFVFILNRYTSFEIPVDGILDPTTQRITGTYTIDSLLPGTNYKGEAWFKTTDNRVIKFTVNFTTEGLPDTSSPLTIPKIIRR